MCELWNRGLKPKSELRWLSAYVRLFHLLGFFFGHLSEAFALSADNFTVAIANQLFVVLKTVMKIKPTSTIQLLNKTDNLTLLLEESFTKVLLE